MIPGLPPSSFSGEDRDIISKDAFKRMQEKAESFDILMKRGETKIIEENKQLREAYSSQSIQFNEYYKIVEKIKEFGNHKGVDKEWAFDQIYQQILGDKDEI